MMEVHIDLDEEELAYVEENGLTEILQDNLGQVKHFPVWLQIRLISAGLEPVLSHFDIHV